MGRGIFFFPLLMYIFFSLSLYPASGALRGGEAPAGLLRAT